jgi:hypothetical protein
MKILANVIFTYSGIIKLRSFAYQNRTILVNYNFYIRSYLRAEQLSEEIR